MLVPIGLKFSVPAREGGGVDVDLLELGVVGQVLHVAVGDVDGQVEDVAGQVAAAVGRCRCPGRASEAEGAAGGREVAAGVDLDRRRPPPLLVAKVSSVAVMVPLTTICVAAVEVLKSTVSPVAKLSVPLSVSVWPSVSTTETLGPTVSVAPDATVKPPGKTYWRLDVLVPIGLRPACPLGGWRR